MIRKFDSFVNNEDRVLVPNGLDLSQSNENGDNQAVDSITWDNGFSTPDTGTVNFTAEIVPAGTRDTTGGSSGSFTDNVNVVDNPLPPNSNFIGLTMTFYDDYSNTSKAFSTVYTGNLDAGTNQHAEPYPAASDEQAVQTIGPYEVLTDWSWLWPRYFIYYIRIGELKAIPSDFYDRMKELDFSPRSVQPEDLIGTQRYFEQLLLDNHPNYKNRK